MLDRIRPLIQVDLIFRDRRGRFTRRQRYKNTLSNYALAAVAQWLSGTSNVSGGGGVVGPNYVALGNGVGLPAPTDIAAFAEVNGARVLCSSRSQYLTYYAMLVGFFAATVPQIKYTEAILTDGAVGAATVGTGGVLAAATTLPLGASAPAVTGSATAGQRMTAYINDGASSEYVQIATTAAASATSWTLATGLTYAHAAAIPIVVFTGNIFTHVNLTNADLSAGSETLTVQWKILVAGN